MRKEEEQKRKERNKNNIDYEVVYNLFKFVAHHLRRDWSNIEKKRSLSKNKPNRPISILAPLFILISQAKIPIKQKWPLLF